MFSFKYLVFPKTRYKIVNKKGVWTPFFIAKQQGSRVPTRCEASRKGGVFIAKQQGSRVPTRCKASRKGRVFIAKQQGSRVPTRCEASRKGGVFIAKQQGSRVPTRCEASWKGGVLIYLTIILYKPFVGHTIKCKCMVDTFCGFFHNNGALDLHSNFIQLFFSPLQDSLLFVNK
ncbi:hypothetical protein VJI94_06630 [Parvimonas sp. D9]|nr:hypothetical protein [Parvimonas sp. D9]